MKPGGWDKYGEATNEIAAKICQIVEEVDDIEEVIKKVDKLLDNAKFSAFGKTKISKRKQADRQVAKDMETDKAIAQDLIARQSNQIEKEILEIKSSKQGRASKVFKMKSRIGGSKIGSQDAHAIKDPVSGHLLVATAQIKQATLDYNCEVLKNNHAEEGFEELIKLKEELH